MPKALGIVGVGTGAPFGGGSKAGGLPAGDFTLVAGLSIGLTPAGTVDIYPNDFINNPGSSTVFELARAVAGPYAGVLTLSCADVLVSPVTVYVRATTPVLTASKINTVEVSDGFGVC